MCTKEYYYETNGILDHYSAPELKWLSVIISNENLFFILSSLNFCLTALRIWPDLHSVHNLSYILCKSGLFYSLYIFQNKNVHILHHLPLQNVFKHTSGFSQLTTYRQQGELFTIAPLRSCYQGFLRHRKCDFNNINIYSPWGSLRLFCVAITKNHRNM